ncbi:MAG: energy transducer TonB [Pseudomonadales bacterium]
MDVLRLFSRVYLASVFVCLPLFAAPATPPPDTACSLTPDTDQRMDFRPGYMPRDYDGSISEFRDTITRLEDQLGVYDAALIPELIGLGLALQAQGQHGSSVAPFKRALHLSRINDGLYNLGQVPILTRIVAGYDADDDGLQTARTLDYLLQLERHHYGAEDPHLLPVLCLMIDRHLGASERELSGKTTLELIAAYSKLKKTIRIIDQNFGSNDSRLTELLFSLAVTHFRLELYRDKISDALHPSLARKDSAMYHFINGGELTTARIMPYNEGRDALARRMELIRDDPHASAENKFEAMLALGDWYFLFNKRDDALEVYHQARSIFADKHVAPDVLSQAFDQPKVLSFDRLGKAIEENDATEYVDVRFTVSAYGRARNIEIGDANTPYKTVRQALRAIKPVRFRPRLVEGKPVSTKGVTYRHAVKVKNKGTFQKTARSAVGREGPVAVAFIER